ncbi:MAG: dihydropteroate synthase [Bacteroidia bacterium]|jgi:dihydropteroate synthase|nr:dihydropteroate synthase [Bacteroidia bacterium]
MTKPEDTHFKLTANGRLLALHRPVVMGILNLTPDSFYDGGRYTTADAALAQTERMVQEGAAIIDLGAVSTRPGSVAPDENEEWRRIYEVLPLLRRRFPEIWLSADTFRASIVQKAAAEGIDLINDISGGSFDSELISAVAESRLPYILMHIQGTPATMQQEPHYHDVVAEVSAWFDAKIAALQAQGITQIVLDPGFGFGKTVEHNYRLLAALPQFVQKGFPLLAGVSRKSMITKLLGIGKNDALSATTAVHTHALLRGAHILRAHDVKEAVQAVKIFEAVSEVK